MSFCLLGRRLKYGTMLGDEQSGFGLPLAPAPAPTQGAAQLPGQATQAPAPAPRAGQASAKAAAASQVPATPTGAAQLPAKARTKASLKAQIGFAKMLEPKAEHVKKEEEKPPTKLEAPAAAAAPPQEAPVPMETQMKEEVEEEPEGGDAADLDLQELLNMQGGPGLILPASLDEDSQDTFGHFEPPLPEGPIAKRARLLEEKQAQEFDTPLSPEVLSNIKAACDLHLDPNSKEVAIAKKLSKFSTMNKQAFLKLGGFGKLVPTKLGSMFLSDKAATAFLMALQTMNPVQSNTLHSKFCLLKKGIRSTDLPAAHMPAWACEGAAPPPVLARYLKHLAKTQASSKPAAQQQGFLTPDHIATYCTNLLIEFRVTQFPAVEPYIDALFMRCQSGRSIRAVNLFDVRMSNVGFKSGGASGESVPFIEVTITKPLSKMAASTAVRANPKTTLLLIDTISKELFDIWWDFIPDQVKGNPNYYFFPAKGAHGFLWDQPLTYAACEQFVQHTASSLGLANSQEHLATFQLKAIRQGTAAESAAIIKGALASRNTHLGRAASSRMEVEVYAPTTALLAPGPLFEPLAANAFFDSALQHHFTDMKGSLLCTACGYCQCPCNKCRLKAAGKNLPTGLLHTCWLSATDTGRVGKKSKKHLPETEGQFNARPGFLKCLMLGNAF